MMCLSREDSVHGFFVCCTNGYSSEFSLTLKRENETLDAIFGICKHHQIEEEKSRGEIKSCILQ